MLDVDGVLTDGRLYYGGDDVELKAFNIQDGHGIKMLRATGVEVAIITGRTSRAVELRAAEPWCAVPVSRRRRQARGLRSTACAREARCRLRRRPWAMTCRIFRSCAAADSRHACRRRRPWSAATSTMLRDRPGGAGAVREIVRASDGGAGHLEATLQEYLR